MAQLNGLPLSPMRSAQAKNPRMKHTCIVRQKYRTGLSRIVLVIAEAVLMTRDDQSHHVLQIEPETLQRDFFIHIFDFPVGSLLELLKFRFAANFFFEETAVFLV